MTGDSIENRYASVGRCDCGNVRVEIETTRSPEELVFLHEHFSIGERERHRRSFAGDGA